VGIDFAPSMIEFSREIAKQMEISDKCEFICQDLLTYTFESSFDVVLALGFFDYIKQPEEVFQRIIELKPCKFIASFPNLSSIWGLQRKIRYHLFKKCPIYSYDLERLEQLYSKMPFSNYQIVPCAGGFVGIAETR
jgi:ubiquinone/menaquinone biosynthesis C-methylase UbiE